MNEWAMQRPKWLLVLFGGALVLWTAWLIRDLLLSTVLAGFLVVLFWPLQRWLLSKIKNRRMPAAMILTTVTLLAVVLPVAFVLYLLLQQIADTLTTLRGAIGRDGLNKLFEGTLPPPALHALHRLQRYVPIPTERLQEELTSLAQKIPKTLEGLAGLSLRSMVHLLFLSFGIFYFFLDGDRFLAFLRDISPFEPHQTRAFFHEFESVAWAMVFGSGLSAVLGAIIASVGYAVLQVPSPVFWGVLTGIFTLAPGIGSALIFMPLAAGLVVLGHTQQGIGVVLYCFVFLVVINDSLVRPILVGQRLRLHPFLILLSIFGGVEAYGVSGLFVGPLAAALAVSVLRIYHRDEVAYTDLPSEIPGHVKVGT